MYFHYWKLQNDPEYIEYWKEQKVYVKDAEKDPQKALAQHLAKFDDASLIKQGNLSRKLGIGHHLVDPFKKINWESFIDSNKVDPDIVNCLIWFPLFQPVKIQAYHVEKGLVKAKFALNAMHNKSKLAILNKIACEKEEDVVGIGNPILRLLIDLNHDKKDILEKVSMYIDACRKERLLDQKSRDQINKFYIYAQVWDLRKSPNKKTFPEIGRELRVPISTIKSRFRKAFEAIYGIKYDRDYFDRTKRIVHKEALDRTCEKCRERNSCKELCPDIIPFVMQDEGKLREKQTPNFNLILDTYNNLRTSRHKAAE